MVDEITKPARKSILTLNRPLGKVEEFHDVKFVRGLLSLLKGKYNTDEGYLYMQGMSMGNVMTSQVARNCGKLFYRDIMLFVEAAVDILSDSPE